MRIAKWFGNSRKIGPPAPAGARSWASAPLSASLQGCPSARATPSAAQASGDSFGPSLMLKSKPSGTVTSLAQLSPRRQPPLASRLAAEASESAAEAQMSRAPSPSPSTAVER